jgi:peptidoglycan hydrolase CwlO-like protein
MNKRLPLPLLGLLALSAFITAPLAAEVYKSVDESGQTVYSDTPASGQAETIKLDPAPSQERTRRAQEEVEQLNRKVDEMTKERRSHQADQADAKAESKRQQADCEAARGKLKELESVPPNRRLIIDPDGTSRRVSWEEMQQHLEQARQQVKQTCK